MMVFSTGWSEGYDGPGRRLVVYLKGCNFQCRWCGNPEGMQSEPEMLYYPARTRHAAEACPYGAARGPSLKRDKCRQCRDTSCISVARNPAFELAGQSLTVSALVDRATTARQLFEPDGGVTFSGGEPTLQADELLHALKELKSAGIHTAVETNASTDAFSRVASEADLIIADIKCADPVTHREWTGADNASVLRNLGNAANGSTELLVRVTVVTGVNDSEEEMDGLTAFLGCLAAGRPSLRVELLRMHHFGEPKCAALDREYPMRDVPCPTPGTMGRFKDKLSKAGVCVLAG